jgi:hypothetical protein
MDLTVTFRFITNAIRFVSPVYSIELVLIVHTLSFHFRN